MKRFLTFILMAIATGTTFAQTDNDGKYTLKNGNLTMVIDAAKGAKILSFKYTVLFWNVVKKLKYIKRRMKEKRWFYTVL
jgi:hypothetical protein